MTDQLAKSSDAPAAAATAPAAGRSDGAQAAAGKSNAAAVEEKATAPAGVAESGAATAAAASPASKSSEKKSSEPREVVPKLRDKSRLSADELRVYGRVVHLVYLGGCHYNSVRAVDDGDDGLPSRTDLIGTFALAPLAGARDAAAG